MKCIVCGNEVGKDSQALCRKLLGRNVKKIMCLSCLSNYLEVDEEELQQRIEEFKSEGCTLFK